MKKDKKQWFNKKYQNKKFKKKTFENLKKSIDKNSLVFFAIQKKIDNKEIVDSSIDNVEKKIKNNKSRNKKIFNVFFLILNIVLVVAIFYNFAKEQGGIQPLSTLFANKPRWTFLFVALGLFVVTMIFNTLKFMFLIYGRTKKWRPWFSFKLAAIGRYYDNITPLGSGGQPFELYYLKKNGYSGDIATAIPLAKYMAWQMAFMTMAIIVLCSYPNLYESSPVVIICAWVGLICVMLLFSFVLFMSITKKMGASIIVGILKLLNKMHIIKDYKKALIKVLRFVKQYQFCIKTFAKNPLIIISVLVSSIGALISNALIAYFVYVAFTATPVVSWWDIICKSFICELAVCFFPLPGGSGASELSFNDLLGSLFTEGTLFWGILIWRFLTYYIYIVQGGIILICELFKSKKKNKKLSNI